jgi:hypothetical protein
MELNFDLESYNRALVAKGLPPATAEEFYGCDEDTGPKPLSAKERAKRKKKRRMQRNARKRNRSS